MSLKVIILGISFVAFVSNSALKLRPQLEKSVGSKSGWFSRNLFEAKGGTEQSPEEKEWYEDPKILMIITGVSVGTVLFVLIIVIMILCCCNCNNANKKHRSRSSRRSKSGRSGKSGKGAQTKKSPKADIPKRDRSDDKIGPNDEPPDEQPKQVSQQQTNAREVKSANVLVTNETGAALIAKIKGAVKDKNSTMSSTDH